MIIIGIALQSTPTGSFSYFLILLSNLSLKITPTSGTKRLEKE